ncbi:hypothetical protein HWV62_21830 [Athelia sp. TMB]|nr:hypothetical protein HWV62_21830 [Athelia sp. TMB]
MLMHATLALIWLPLVAAYISVEYDPGSGYMIPLLSLVAWLILAIVGLMDYLAMTRTINRTLFTIVDLILILALPLCTYDGDIDGLQFMTNYQGYDKGDYLSDVVYGIFAIMPIILSASYVIILGVLAVIHRETGIQCLHYAPANVNEASRPLVGRRKVADDGQLAKHCSDFLFNHSYFRKHSFEPTWLAILRGSVAVLACTGLVFFSLYSGLDAQDGYGSGGRSVTEEILSFSTVLNPDNDRALSVTATTLDSSLIPSDFLVQDITGTPLDSYTNSTDLLPPNQVFNCPLTLPACVNPHSNTTTSAGFNVSWTGPATMLIWPTVGEQGAWINSSQVNYTNPLVLSPNMQYNVTLTFMSYHVGKDAWFFFHYDIIYSSPADEGTSATFTFQPFQQVVAHQTLGSTSPFPIVAGMLSRVGGIFAAIDGLFALTFGRTVMAVIMGSRTSSPFGLFGMFARGHFKRMIKKNFPRLQADIEGRYDTEDEDDLDPVGASEKQGGMEESIDRRRKPGLAAYIHEVAIDTSYIR